MPTIIERARRYVLKCDRAVSGQGGHDRTVHVACVLVQGFDLVDADALALLREWNAGCSPPWNEGELIHKVQSARAKEGCKPRGYLLGKSWDGGVGGAPFRARPIAMPPPPLKPKFKADALRRIAAKTGEIKNVVAFISERSPIRVETQDSASVLRRLYARGSGEKVIIFNYMKSRGQLLWEADKSDMIQNENLPTGGRWRVVSAAAGDWRVLSESPARREAFKAVGGSRDKLALRGGGK